MFYKPFKGPASIGTRMMAVLLLLALVFGTAACGKKPGFVDPLLGTEKGAFPPVYPDPSTL